MYLFGIFLDGCQFLSTCNIVAVAASSAGQQMTCLFYVYRFFSLFVCIPLQLSQWWYRCAATVVVVTDAVTMVLKKNGYRMGKKEEEEDDEKNNEKLKHKIECVIRAIVTGCHINES